MLHALHNTTPDNAHITRCYVENDHIITNLINSDNGKLLKLTFVLCDFICILITEQQSLREWRADLVYARSFAIILIIMLLRRKSHIYV